MRGQCLGDCFFQGYRVVGNVDAVDLAELHAGDECL